MKKEKYTHLTSEQKQLLDIALNLFNCKNMTELGKFFGFSNPYPQMNNAFKAATPNLYLKRIIETKLQDQETIKALEERLKEAKILYLQECKINEKIKQQNNQLTQDCDVA